MKDLERAANPFGDDKILANCGIFGMMNCDGRRSGGQDIIKAMANMHDRGNGLGGGYAAYGIYPEHAEDYCLHIMFESEDARRHAEEFLHHWFQVALTEPIPTRRVAGVLQVPLLWRYFVRVPSLEAGGRPGADAGPSAGGAQPHEAPGAAGTGSEGAGGVSRPDADDYVVARVMEINTTVDGAFVFSSGRNMGVFKGVGHAEDIGEFYRLDEYDAYLWTGHSRFPTNTQAWWGGAHPFSILDWTVVHNGELSSYGANRAFLEMYGYYCSMHTDTEVLAYAVDLLMRRHQLPVQAMAAVLAAPLWQDIDRMPPQERQNHTLLRQVYGGLLMNGPFAIVVAHGGEMVGLRDRIGLRPLVAAVRGSTLYLASEEAPIRLVAPELDAVWQARGGVPVVGSLERGILEGSQPVPTSGLDRGQVARAVGMH